MPGPHIVHLVAAADCSEGVPQRRGDVMGAQPDRVDGLPRAAGADQHAGDENFALTRSPSLTGLPQSARAGALYFSRRSQVWTAWYSPRLA